LADKLTLELFNSYDTSSLCWNQLSHNVI